MTTLIFTHPVCAEHDPGRSHPERPERLRAVIERLKGPEFESLVWREAAPASVDTLALAHDRDYVSALLATVPAEGRRVLDADTYMSPRSGEAALHAAGALCAAVDAVIAGTATTAFCAVRPPGHHAEARRAMGFCLFNNVAIGAFHARARHGLRRVAVVDFDVHHGNGTQHMFERDADLFFGSTHQWGIYPGTGAAEETGVGNIVNAPLPAFSGSREFRDAMSGRILPALDQFEPELVLISAGFDAHARDPLAMLNLEEDDFAWATREIAAVARRRAEGRVVSTLEGGYDLEALAASTAAHVAALMAA